MNNNLHKFILEPHHPGDGTKYTCPYCGRRKCFTRYINTETGQYLDETVGICDHKNRCNINYTPRQFFADHPNFSVDDYQGNGVKAFNLKPMERRQQSVFIPADMLKGRHSPDSTFCQWLRSIAPSEEDFQRVYNDYILGIYARDAVVFWYIDTYGRVHDGKIMFYLPDGHRDKHRSPNFIGTHFAGRLNLPRDYSQQREWSLFGSQLLRMYPDKPVALVESEKTAIIMSMFHNHHIWLATGGCKMLNAKVIEPLRTRRVDIFPDAGWYDEWRKVFIEAGFGNFTISAALESCSRNTDIADILLLNLHRSQ